MSHTMPQKNKSFFCLFLMFIQFLQHHLFKRLSFLHDTDFITLSEISCSNMRGPMFGLYSVILIYMSIFLSVPQHSDYCSFIIILEIRQRQPSNFIFCQSSFDHFYLSYFHMNFKISLSVSIGNSAGIFIGIALNL